MSFKVHGEVRHAHQGIRERLEVRRWPSAKAPEQPGSFDLSDHRLCFRARDGAASQGHIVVDLDHHAATAVQEHRAQLRIASHANDNFYTFSDHLLHRHADDPSLCSCRICRICSLPLDGGGPGWGWIRRPVPDWIATGTITPSQPSPIEGEGT